VQRKSNVKTFLYLAIVLRSRINMMDKNYNAAPTAPLLDPTLLYTKPTLKKLTLGIGKFFRLFSFDSY
jgi:hypothetical protein